MSKRFPEELFTTCLLATGKRDPDDAECCVCDWAGGQGLSLAWNDHEFCSAYRDWLATNMVKYTKEQFTACLLATGKASLIAHRNCVCDWALEQGLQNYTSTDFCYAYQEWLSRQAERPEHVD